MSGYDILRQSIVEYITFNRVMLFMKGDRRFPISAASAELVDILSRQQVTFATFDVTTAPDMREAVKLYSNCASIPQLYIDGEFVGDCDTVRALAVSGALAGLLRPS